METRNYFKRESRPTLQQLRYLSELESLGNGWGAVSSIARVCQVSPAAVSRYLKTCVEWGYLTEDYRFTEAGKKWLLEYKELIWKLREYFKDAGVPEKEQEEGVRTMIENINPDVLELLLSEKAKQGRKIPTELEHVKRCRVYFKIFKMNKGRTEKNSFSMANKGFMQEAYFAEGDTGYNLELRLQTVKEASRINGRKMQGSLSTLRYEQEGMVKEAVIEGDKVYIPAESFRFHRGLGGELKGFLPVTVTSSVGRIHMPESTALLVFWI